MHLYTSAMMKNEKIILEKKEVFSQDFALN